MSDTIFETNTDENGNVSVRISRKVQVLTNEEADSILVKYKRMESENAKLRKLVKEWYPHMKKRVGIDALWQWGCMDIIRELEIEVE